MTDVPEILRQSTGDPIEVDVAADLRRGRTALKRRRTRLATGIAGVAAAGIAGVVVLTQVLPGSATINDEGQPGWASAPSAGGSSDASPTAEPSPDAVTEYRFKQQQFVDCLREHGVRGLPDPDEFGGVAIPRDSLPQGKPGKRVMAACESITAELDMPLELQQKRDDYLASQMTAEEKQIEVDYANCMQDNGVGDYPDPAANGLPGTPAWELPNATVPMPKALERASLACLSIRDEAGEDAYQAADPSNPEFFDLTVPPPAGWVVVDHNPNGVMIVRDGETGGFHTSSFVGKVMLLLSDKSQPMAHGTKVEFNGRTFYDNQINEDSVILNVQVESGDWLQVQYPREAGLDRDAMIGFLDGVIVKEGAIGSIG